MYYVHDENNNKIYIDKHDCEYYDITHVSINDQVILDSKTWDCHGHICFEMSYSELSPSREIKGQLIYQCGYIGKSFAVKEFTDKYVDLEELFIKYPNVIKIIYTPKVIQIETECSSCFFCKEPKLEIIFPVYNRKIEQPVLQLTKKLADIDIYFLS